MPNNKNLKIDSFACQPNVNCSATLKNCADCCAKQRQELLRLNYTLATINEGVWDWDIVNGTVAHNQSWLDILGLDDQLLVHPMSTYVQIIHPEDRAEVIKQIELCLTGKKSYRHRYRMQTADGRLIWVSDRGDVVERDQKGQATRMVGAIIDVTELVEKELKITELAYTDPLTKLPNRYHFYEDVTQKLNQYENRSHSCAIIYMDVRNLKLVNDTFGHTRGDQLLKHLAGLLGEFQLNSQDMIARLGSDEFIIALFIPEHQQNIYRKQIQSVALQVKDKLKKYSDHYYPNLEIDLSIGFHISQKEESLDTIIQYADFAMLHSKQSLNQDIFEYQIWMQTKYLLRQELRLAVTKDIGESFRLFLQPIVNQQQQVVSGEFLLRWVNSKGELVSPLHFIPELEAMNKLHLVTLWITEQALHYIQDNELHDLRFSINISPSHFLNCDFMARLKRLLANFPESQQLVFEITETIMFENFDRIKASVDELIQYGVRFSLDDFGTGYSSIDMLLKLPINSLKIDRSFVSNMEQSKNQSVINLILTMAESMNLICVAEGIELKEHFDYFENKPNQLFQGYYFSQPIPQADFIPFILNKNEAQIK